MAFKYLSPEWERVRDLLFTSGTLLNLGNCNYLASEIVERFDGPDTNILEIVIENFSLRDVPKEVQQKIKDYLMSVPTGR